MQLTREQHLALMDDRNIVVTANAGSGKTSVLVNRYLGLLTEGKASINEIVAITFTRKAAHEMLARVTREIDKSIAASKIKLEIEEDDNSKIQLSRLKRIRERLYNARIATFHSFCSRLARDYPVEADISPNFTELSEADGIRFKLDAVRSAIEDYVTDPQKKKIVISLSANFELKNLEEALVDLISDSDRLQKISRIYERSPEEISTDFNRQFDEIVSDYILKLKEFSSKIDRNKYDRKYNAIFDECYKLVDDVCKASENMDYKQMQLLYESLNGKELRIKNSKFTTITTKFLDRKEARLFVKIDGLLTNIDQITRNKGLTVDYIKKSKELIELAKLAGEYYKSAKRRSEALDFDDLISIANELLDKPEVVSDVRSQMKYLLVDEFQDTDEIQFSIISKIIGDFSYKSSRINLFIVGDGKQSIYGFRGADVRVFHKAQQSIRKGNSFRLDEGRLINEPTVRGDKVIDLKADEMLGIISLNVSYRLKPTIAAFCNKVFGKIMDSSVSEFDADYEEFIHARTESDSFHGQDRINASPEFGTINILTGRNINGGDYEDDDEGTETAEITGSGELIARQVLKLVSDKDERKVYDEKNLPRKPEFSDIAVIARAKDKLSPVISAFIRNGIPYKLYSGGGFFNAAEISDLISFIKFLTDTNDDLSLAAILRSPYFSIADEELMSIGLIPIKGSFWKKFQIYVKESSGESSKPFARRALDLLEYFLVEARRLPIRRLLQEIREKSGWDGVIETNPAKEQILANVNKFALMAAEFENRGFKTIRDFIRELDILSENSSQQEAQVLSGSNAVALLTTHSVKGLEFPIVFIAAANARQKNQDSLFFDADRGVLFKYSRRLADTPFDVEVNLPLRFMLKEFDKTRTRAEEMRVFYVAATRARDHLFFACDIRTTSKTINSSNESKTSNFLLEGLDRQEFEIEDTDEFSIEESTLLKTLTNGEVKTKEINFNINFINTIEKIDYQEKTSRDLHVAHRAIFIKPNMSYENEMFSATKMAAYESSANDYEMRYLIGLPARGEDKIYAMETEPDDSKITASDRGNVIHRLLASMNDWIDENCEINHDSFNTILGSIFRNLRLAENAALAQEFEKQIQAIISTKIFKFNIKEILQSKKEFTLTIPVGDDFLSGTIDLLYMNGNMAEIWDWKTNQVSRIKDAEILAAQYKLQMLVYAYLVSKRFAQKSVKTKLFFSSLARNDVENKHWIIENEFNDYDFVKFEKEYFEKFEMMKVY